jgi:hypothetical protein
MFNGAPVLFREKCFANLASEVADHGNFRSKSLQTVWGFEIFGKAEFS